MIRKKREKRDVVWKRRTEMKLTKDQIKEFETVTRPLIQFINNNGYPHITVIVDNTRAEIVEGIAVFVTQDYLKG